MNFSDIKILVFNLFVVTDGFLSVKIDTDSFSEYYLLMVEGNISELRTNNLFVCLF